MRSGGESIVLDAPTPRGGACWLAESPMTTEIPKKMRAIGWPHAASPEPPGLLSVDTPVPAPGQVLVRVVASAVNPADDKVASGSFVGRLLHARVEPLVVGYDFSGPVAACGAGVDDLKVGDEVFGHLAYAGATRRGPSPSGWRSTAAPSRRSRPACPTKPRRLRPLRP